MISNVGSQSQPYINQVPQNSGKATQVAQVEEVKSTDRKDILSEQIQNGEYHVDVSKAAQAIAEEIVE